MWEFWKNCFIRVKMAMASGKQDEVSACTNYFTHIITYIGDLGDFGEEDQALAVSYLREQIRIKADESKEINTEYLNRQ